MPKGKRDTDVIGDIFGTTRPKIGRATRKLRGAVEPAFPLDGREYTKKKTPKDWMPESMSGIEGHYKRPKY